MARSATWVGITPGAAPWRSAALRLPAGAVAQGDLPVLSCLSAPRAAITVTVSPDTPQTPTNQPVGTTESVEVPRRTRSQPDRRLVASGPCRPPPRTGSWPGRSISPAGGSRGLLNPGRACPVGADRAGRVAGRRGHPRRAAVPARPCGRRRRRAEPLRFALRLSVERLPAVPLTVILVLPVALQGECSRPGACTRRRLEAQPSLCARGKVSCAKAALCHGELRRNLDREVHIPCQQRAAVPDQHLKSKGCGRGGEERKAVRRQVHCDRGTAGSAYCYVP